MISVSPTSMKDQIWPNIESQLTVVTNLWGTLKYNLVIISGDSSGLVKEYLTSHNVTTYSILEKQGVDCVIGIARFFLDKLFQTNKTKTSATPFKVWVGMIQFYADYLLSQHRLVRIR